MSTVHNCAGGNGGLVPAGSALIGFASANRITFVAAALGAYEPFWKSLTEQFFPTGFLRTESLPKLFEADCCCLCHDISPVSFSGVIIAYFMSEKADCYHILYLAELSR